jgi:hypothetical protein
MWYLLLSDFSPQNCMSILKYLGSKEKVNSSTHTKKSKDFLDCKIEETKDLECLTMNITVNQLNM